MNRAYIFVHDVSVEKRKVTFDFDENKWTFNVKLKYNNIQYTYCKFLVFLIKSVDRKTKEKHHFIENTISLNEHFPRQV